MTELSASCRYTSARSDPLGLREELGRARAAVRHTVGRPDGPGGSDNRQRLDHDVLHELSTIMLLASLLSESADVGTESRRRARQIMTETRWLENLVRSYHDDAPFEDPPDAKAVRAFRLDSFVESVSRTAQLHVSTRVSIEATPVYVRVERVTFGRALRNLIWNGLEAAGPTGELAIRVATRDGVAIIDVEDDGPGYTPTRAAGAHLGLEIVRQIITSCGGELEIGGGEMGGCRMRLILPVARL
jgi:signal transduction histidine kinase